MTAILNLINRQITKEKKLELISEGIKNRLFNDSFEKKKLTNDEIAFIIVDLKKRVEAGIALRAVNHKKTMEAEILKQNENISVCNKALDSLREMIYPKVSPICSFKHRASEIKEKYNYKFSQL